MWNIIFLITGAIFIALLIFIFFSKEVINSKENKYFKYLIIINVIEYIIEISLQLSVRLYSIDMYIVDILAKLYLASLFTWFSFFSIYTFIVCLNKTEEVDYEKKFNFTKVISLIIWTIGTLVLILLPFSKYHNNDKMYIIGMSVDALKIMLGIYMIVWLFMLFKNIKDIKNKKYLPIFLILLLGGLTAVIQTFDPSILISTMVATFICYTMYFTIENPDVKMIEQLEIARETADKANSAKSEFLSNMSHEIRTPLNAIVGFSESLKDDNIPPESMEKVNDIIMASNNLLDIVNGILDISKIEANKLEIIEKEYNIQDILDELIVLTKARIGDKGLEFKVSIDPSLPAVLYGDCTRVKQVVLNILTNAVKYTKQGWVDFKVSSVIKDNVCRLIISVEDSGIGIKEESLPKLFSKFDRLNVEKEMTIEGTGLGLAITKKLIELMNGKIIVQSVYGQGSKFTISIDQRIVSMEKPAIKETKVSESKIIDAHGAKILLVDDNALNIKVASTLLQKYNFNIDSANSGQECIDKINQGNQYDIVFLDDMMPKMSGREVIKKLKENPSYKIPTVALTANAIDGMKEEYLSIGFDDYLSKPIEKLELERVIKKYLHNNNVNEANSASGIANSVIDMTLAIPRIESSPVQNKISYAGKKILLVDDNELNLKVEEMSLKKYGFEIIKVTSGTDAIAKVIENNNYDLVLLDDMMPNLDGPKTLDSLKEIDGYKTPTVLLTASSYDEVKEKIDSHGFNGYLVKPLKGEELDKLLKELLN